MNDERAEPKTMMTHDDLVAHFKSRGIVPDDRTDKRKLMLTKKLIRCVDRGAMIAAVGSDRTKDDQIHGVVDAVHWYLQSHGDTFGRLRIVFGQRKKPSEMDEVLNCAVIMIHNLTMPLDVSVEVDFIPAERRISPCPDDRNWMAQIKLRERETPPALATELEKRVGSPSFRWYRNVTADFWSGRVEGLQVCTVKTNGETGVLDVGSSGKTEDRYARKAFIEIAGASAGGFDASQIDAVAGIIRKLVASRASGILGTFQREHMLESMVLRRAVEVISVDGPLAPVCGEYPFQFPTLWSPKGSPRFIDALMRSGDTPWAIELKEPGGSRVGQGYRHAITQAVLYREYIRRAESMHDWFREKGLEPAKCRSAIAFPRIDDTSPAQWQLCLKQHQAVAKAFGVDVIHIDGFTDDTP